MKQFKLVASFTIMCLTVIGGYAQDLTPPKDGAVIRLVNTKIEVSGDKDLSNEVWLVKSKRYQKRNFGGLEAKAPEGVKITFDAKDESKNSFMMNVKVGDDAKPGKYMVVIKGSGENSHKVKSSLISIVVAEGTFADTDKQQ